VLALYCRACGGLVPVRAKSQRSFAILGPLPVSEDTPLSATASVQAEGVQTLVDGDVVLLGDLECGVGSPVPEREQVEPYLAALLQAEHLNLLVGSGLTTGLAHLAGVGGGANMNAQLSIGTEALRGTLEASAAASADRARRGVPNIEDRLRVAIAAADGLRYVEDDRALEIRVAVDSAVGELRASAAGTEAGILASIDAVVAGSMTLRGLLMTFLGSFAGRTPTRDRLHVFTTNYDRVIEWGAELAGLRLVDRFVGSLEPVFRSSRLEVDYHYSPPGTVRDPRHLDGVLRLTKLHGSLDWRWDTATRRVLRTALPFGASSATSATDLLIFPNAAKDVETTFHPYADLFRDYSAALCRPHTAIVTYGYGFGDDHVNRVIKDMLTIPSTHLLVISFDDPGQRIARFAEDHRRLGQVSLLIGPTLASLPALVGKWLPWPSAEFLLQRRAQIFRDRSTGIASHRDPPVADGSRIDEPGSFGTGSA
jgi:hypothetical protein